MQQVELTIASITKLNIYSLNQHLNQSILSKIEGKRVKGGVHAKLIASLKTQSDTKLFFIGQELDSLKKLRYKADYKLAQNFSPETAQDATIRAERLVQDIEEIMRG